MTTDPSTIRALQTTNSAAPTFLSRVQRAMDFRRSFANDLVSLAVLGMFCAGPLAAQQQGLTTLAAQRDQTRPLLIFAPKSDDAQMGIQLRILVEHAAEAGDRQIVAIALPYHSPSPSDVQLSPTEAESARRRFHIDPGAFAVILLGKDGGPKLRADKPISMTRLEKTIDAMPMRQDEVRGKAH